VVAVNRKGSTYEDPPSLSDRIRYRLRRPADPAAANRRLVEAARNGCDLIWIENATMIRPETLQSVKRLTPPPSIAGYAEDDMMSRKHGSVWIDRSLPLFDLWVTTKSFNAEPHEMPARGVRRVHFTNNSFDPHIHRPVEPAANETEDFGAEVSFVGTYEAARAKSMLHLAEGGVSVRVWGNGWQRMAGRHAGLRIEGRPVYNDEYAKVVGASKINLAFLRKANRDLQTTRSVEIPACRGFMLHERNPEVTALFEEGVQAAYFGDDPELLAGCRWWLADDHGRQIIAEAGYQKATSGGHSHHHLLRTAFQLAMSTIPTAP